MRLTCMLFILVLSVPSASNAQNLTRVCTEWLKQATHTQHQYDYSSTALKTFRAVQSISQFYSSYKTFLQKTSDAGLGISWQDILFGFEAQNGSVVQTEKHTYVFNKYSAQEYVNYTNKRHSESRRKQFVLDQKTFAKHCAARKGFWMWSEFDSANYENQVKVSVVGNGVPADELYRYAISPKSAQASCQLSAKNPIKVGGEIREFVCERTTNTPILITIFSKNNRSRVIGIPKARKQSCCFDPVPIMEHCGKIVTTSAKVGQKYPAKFDWSIRGQELKIHASGGVGVSGLFCHYDLPGYVGSAKVAFKGGFISHNDPEAGGSGLTIGVAPGHFRPASLYKFGPIKNVELLVDPNDTVKGKGELGIQISGNASSQISHKKFTVFIVQGDSHGPSSLGYNDPKTSIVGLSVTGANPALYKGGDLVSFEELVRNMQNE